VAAEVRGYGSVNYMPWPKGKRRSEDERSRISKGLMGIKRSDEWCERASVRMKDDIESGRYKMPSFNGPHTDESKRKQAMTRTERIKSGEIVLRGRGGWKLSDEVCKNMSVAKKGIKKSESAVFNSTKGLILGMQKNDGKCATGGGNKLWMKDRKRRLIALRSVWEIRVAQWLDERDIDWEYESVEGIIKTPFGLYVPDFTLTGKGVLVEVKGKLWGVRQLMKINWCAQNGYDIRVIDEKNISDISLNKSWIQRQIRGESPEIKMECE
jgi:hypothetical protein